MLRWSAERSPWPTLEALCHAGLVRTSSGSTAVVLDRFMTRYPMAIFDVGRLKPQEL